MKIGYARVSTKGQNPQAQVDALEAAGCDKIYVDCSSGKLARRPELDKALAAVRTGDILVITKLDRLGRSLKHLMQTAEWLKESGVSLRVLDQGLDTTHAAGRMFFQFLGAIAEFERELIVERTKDGLAVARARGRTGGQKPKLSARQMRHVRELYDKREVTVEEIAKDFGVTRATVYRVLERVPSPVNPS